MNLPWMTLGNKVRGGGIAGAVTFLVVWALNAWVPGIGEAASPLIEQAVIYGATMLGAYLTPERPELWTGREG